MISGNLEYVISSLPELSFDNSDTFQKEVSNLLRAYNSANEAAESLIFLLVAEAKKFMSKKDFKYFKSIRLHNIHREEFRETQKSVVATFASYVYDMKKELSLYRENRASDEGSSIKHHYDILPELSSNPLKAEEQLLRLKWNKLEELSIGHYSDMAALIIYKLKLEVLLRWWSFNEEHGFQIFQQVLKEDG